MKAIGLLVPTTVDTMLSSEQAAALNRIGVQDIALRDKTHLLELRQAGQPEQMNRTIAALTHPNPLQRTTAPYEVPAGMMADAPRPQTTVERPPFTRALHNRSCTLRQARLRCTFNLFRTLSLLLRCTPQKCFMTTLLPTSLRCKINCKEDC